MTTLLRSPLQFRPHSPRGRASPTVGAALMAALLAACASTAGPADDPASADTDQGSAEQTEEEDGAPSGTEPSASETSTEGGASVFVVHHVPDFAAYLEQFDGNESVREKAGVTRAIVAQVDDDSKRVAVHFTVRTLDDVRTFLSGSDYEHLVEADQATDSTLLWVARDLLVELPATVDKGTVSLFAKLAVKDPECLVRELIAAQSTLSGEGLVGSSLHALATSNETAIVHLVAADRTAVERVYSGKTFTALLAKCEASAPERPPIANNEGED